MANRRRRYHNLGELASKESVRRWRESLAGSGQKHALYAINRYVLWRKKRGLPADPDQWVAECMNGNNATLIQEKSTLKSGQQGCGPDWNRCLVLGWRAFTTL